MIWHKLKIKMVPLLRNHLLSLYFLILEAITVVPLCRGIKTATKIVKAIARRHLCYCLIRTKQT